MIHRITNSTVTSHIASIGTPVEYIELRYEGQTTPHKINQYYAHEYLHA